MFDMLTLDELYELHHQLSNGHRATFSRMMGGLPLRPLISPTSEEWAVLQASNSEVFETVIAVGEEITRRENERTALRYA